MDTKFKIGEFVYLVHDPEQYARQVTGILLRETSHLYELTVSTESCYHQEVEIAREKNMLVSLGLEEARESKTRG